MPGVQLQKPSTERAMVYADKNCLDCTKQQMDKLFATWTETMRGYTRKTYKGLMISPWHYYKAKNLENELKEIDS